MVFQECVLGILHTKTDMFTTALLLAKMKPGVSLDNSNWLQWHIHKHEAMQTRKPCLWNLIWQLLSRCNFKWINRTL